jgi:hypothetical protein
MVLAEKNHPSLQQLFATYTVPGPCENNQDPSPLSKCFWGLFEEVSGHFVIATDFSICHSTNVA